MPQVALLDHSGIIASIADVESDEWVTSKSKGVVQLPAAHDMGTKVGSYYYDFDLGSFLPLASGKDDLDRIVDVLCQMVLKLCEKCDITPDEESSSIIHKWFASVR